jgi:hypothetical protein
VWLVFSCRIVSWPSDRFLVGSNAVSLECVAVGSGYGISGGGWLLHMIVGTYAQVIEVGRTIDWSGQNRIHEHGVQQSA